MVVVADQQGDGVAREEGEDDGRIAPHNENGDGGEGERDGTPKRDGADGGTEAVDVEGRSDGRAAQKRKPGVNGGLSHYDGGQMPMCFSTSPSSCSVSTSPSSTIRPFSMM